MKTNKLREILNNGTFSMATRIESTWPTIVELLGCVGDYDYVEFVAEYAPYALQDFENICRAAELHNLATMIKVDFQNRAYVAQKAMASGFQAVLLTDHKTVDEVEESVYMLKADNGQYGRFGYPNSRWIGYQPHLPQREYAKMVNDTVIALMIEKKQALDNIEKLCSVEGIDMVQFGPSDYSMSCGWNMGEHREDCRAAERYMIEVALAHGVEPRCEISSPQEAEYYRKLGVKHFCIGDELKILENVWKQNGVQLQKMLKNR